MNKFSPHKQAVINRFSQRAHDYDAHARLQKIVAARLVRLFPKLDKPDILEIGCGTGLLTGHLLSSYKGARFHITDISKPMLDQCEAIYGERDNMQFSLMDGEHPVPAAKYDLIATSMTAQWFDAPEKSLLQLCSMLKPEGHLIYAAPGPNLFPQWREVLAKLDLPSGLIEVPKLPGQVFEDMHQMKFDSGLHFLGSMKAIGASHPRLDYPGLSAGALRRAIRLFETTMDCCADWHIVYGCLRG